MNTPHGQAGERILAVAVSLAMLVAMSALLRIVPKPLPTNDLERVRVRWQSTPPALAVPVPPAALPSESAQAALPRPAAVPPLRTLAEPPEASSQASAEVPVAPLPVAPAARLDLRLPGDGDDDGLSFAPATSADGTVRLQREPAIKVDGTVFDTPRKRRSGRQKKSEELIYGKDIQQIDPPRPPPDVPFNPALHENPADVASVAKVVQLPVPGLDGEAGQRIEAELNDLRGQTTACAAPARDAALAGPLAQLKELRRLEHRYHNGADPQERDHLLPRQIGKAWNDARRALWQARQQLAGCIDRR